MAAFEKRSLGRTGVEVTSVGLGSATLGGHRVPVAPEDGDRVVRAAWKVGVRYFDTAPFYGFGQAERSIGDALRAMPRGEWVLSSKVGRLLRPRPDAAPPDGFQHPLPFEPVFDYSYDGVMRSFEDSLLRLGLSRIDVLFAHDIGSRQHGAAAHARVIRKFHSGGYRALEELRRSGAVRAIGVGVNEAAVLIEVMEWGDWDVFLLAGRYTLLEQAPIEDLLPRCLGAGISVVIGAPLNTGALAGRDSWNYRPVPAEIVERMAAIKAVCDRHAVPLMAAALQFPLAHPAVAAIIPGPRNAAEFETNLRLLRHPIPPGLWSDLREAGLLHPSAPTPG